MDVRRFSMLMLNLLAFVALNLEVRDLFARISGSTDSLARDFTYSAVWIAYGVALMVVGFYRQSSFTRWLALMLIGATILKVFFYDLSELERGYRILSFIVLGIVLLGISFAYQRKWLRTS